MKATIKNIKEIKKLAINEEVRFNFEGLSYFIDASIIWVNGLCTVAVHNAINSDFSKQLWNAFVKDMKKSATITIVRS